MALRLSKAFGTSPQLWLNLQQAYELRVAEQDPSWRESWKSRRRRVEGTAKRYRFGVNQRTGGKPGTCAGPFRPNGKAPLA